MGKNDEQGCRYTSEVRRPFIRMLETAHPVVIRGPRRVFLPKSSACHIQVVYSLAYLQLGRAYAIAGDNGKAQAAYQTFLNLWKDADPDIPILKQAKAEYAKLQ